jgi:phage recombination protein Bet
MDNVTTLTTRTPAPEWSEDQRALIKRTVAPDATNDELAMFLHVAAKAGLDPLQKQVWFVKRSGRVTIQAGVDGLQARALRMPDCDGIASAVVYEKEDFIFDKAKGEVVKHQSNPFGAQGALVGAWGIVHRRGKAPFVALIRFAEYADSNSPLWKNKPAVMLEKVARSTALRRAYPEDFGGIYDPAEMGREASPEAMKAIEGEVVEVKPEPRPEPALPAADKIAAPKPEAAKVVEAPPAKKSGAPPHYVAKLWARCKQEHGSKAQEAFAAAAREVFGDVSRPSNEWSLPECLDVEHVLFPVVDVP